VTVQNSSSQNRFIVSVRQQFSVRISRLSHFCLVAILFLSIPVQALGHPIRIGIQAPQSLFASPPARLAIEDTVGLLQKAFPDATIAINKPAVDVRLVLPDIRGSSPRTQQVQKQRPFPCLPAPDSSYIWNSTRQAGVTTIHLATSSPEGVACGLYGLLQEKLGVRFIHPRQTIIPARHFWPLPGSFTFSGVPRFTQRGFHIHTLHPIELTEQLNNPATPDAFEDVAAYLDWLARNGQNTFQFFLLRGVNRDAWIPHARRIVAYAHQRGIRCGVEISLTMLQQQAFQAITLLRPYPSYQLQIDETLAWLFQAPWDFVTLEATMGEHLPSLGELLPSVQSHFEQQVMERYNARLLYATHVIGRKVRLPLLPDSGILIHTVMCYSASEPKAPVYGNDNQRFMLEAARTEINHRETWYWPESSYWVGFDSSVPLLLLPYLDSRWEDMETMARIGVNGHLTFSSGWEWGYWLVDWSIARWSWQYADNRRVRATSPLSRLVELFPDPILAGSWREALRLQNHFLKDRELLRYMAALTTFSELPPPLNRPFQPEPAFRYTWLLHDASDKEAESVLQGPVKNLEGYAAAMETVVSRLTARINYLRKYAQQAMLLKPLADELTTGLRVTALRARHRALTLRALVAKRGTQKLFANESKESVKFLSRAEIVRREALGLVRSQEARYRYPVELLARRRPSLTAYSFGYLYPTSVLFFWEREEQQVRQGRFDPFFMNLWDIRRTSGLESLFFVNFY
jgi:hypothetical protein